MLRTHTFHACCKFLSVRYAQAYERASNFLKSESREIKAWDGVCALAFVVVADGTYDRSFVQMRIWRFY